jgi:two-component system phosphate regulon response regulator PhoB
MTASLWTVRQSAIFVSASRDSHDDQERVLDAGADEYMVRPFEPRQLFAKLRAAIRRRQPHGYVDTLTCGPISIDRNTHWVLVNNEPLTLRPMEYKLLEFLMVNQERIISAEELWENVWHQKSLPSDTVRAHINSLRKRLRSKTEGQWIQTIQSRGYRIVQSNHRLEPVRIRA